MTMVPAQNLFKQQKKYDGFAGCEDGYKGSFGLMSRIAGYEYCSEACLGSDLVVGHMAEDESRTSSVNETGSSSKDVQKERNDERWLQLGLGGYVTGPDLKLDNPVQPMAQRGGLVELDLLPGGSSNNTQLVLAPNFHFPDCRPPRPASNTTSGINISKPLFLQPRQEVTWGYSRPPNNPWNPTASSSSSSVPPGLYYSRPFQFPGVDIAGPSSDVRVVEPPPRPHSGIWFVLQASQNQEKEPFLPQIPKSYLRIKDGRMTVRLLMKYLVNKLRLNSESEIEIRCRGQQLLPFFTLQHVRDSIWSSRDAVTLLPNSSTTDHVMILHYGRSA